PRVQPQFGGEQARVARSAHGGDVHGRPVEAVLLHQSGHRRRGHQRQVLPGFEIAAFCEVEVLPQVDLAEHDGMEQTHATPAAPAAPQRILNGLSGRRSHGTGESSSTVRGIASVRHPSDPTAVLSRDCTVVATVVAFATFDIGVVEVVKTVTTGECRRRLRRPQTLPQRSPTPTVAGDRSDSTDFDSASWAHDTPSLLSGFLT